MRFLPDVISDDDVEDGVSAAAAFVLPSPLNLLRKYAAASFLALFLPTNPP